MITGVVSAKKREPVPATRAIRTFQDLENLGAPTLVAEIGCNHTGRLELAKEMVVAARLSGAAFAKFQKRSPKELLSEAEYNAPHPVPRNAYGPTYGLHREALEFTQEQHAELKAFCETTGIGYASSVWDIRSAREICELNPAYIKVPSACNVNFAMLTWLVENFAGAIHVSLGMTARVEERQILGLFASAGRLDDLVLYACTSGYPVRSGEVCLLEIRRLIDAYGDRVRTIGYSGHNLGFAVDLAACTLGAQWIERHFTLDRSMKGTDHTASLEPTGFRALSDSLTEVCEALTFKEAEILPVEHEMRQKLKWRPANER